MSRSAVRGAARQLRSIAYLPGLLKARRAARLIDAGTTGLVFSMNRPLQLHALIASYLAMAKDPAPLSVLYRSTDARFEKAYGEVADAFRGEDLRLVRQDAGRSFKVQVMELLGTVRTRQMFFLVDDIVFTSPFRLSDGRDRVDRGGIFSLRLGRNIVHSYNKQKAMAQPALSPIAGGLQPMVSWRWGRDWNYPLSLDGHVFLTTEIRYMTGLAGFTSPNTYEGALQRFSPLFERREGFGYETSRLVNVPANLVQTDCANRHGNEDVEALLARWDEGFAIDMRAFASFPNRSTHQEIPYSFVERGRSTHI